MSYINRAIEPLLIKKYQSYKSVAVAGTIICTGEYKLKLRENLYSLPIEYI